MGYKDNEKDRVKIDAYLEKIQTLYANMGSDSTEAEKKKAFRTEARYQERIRKIDAAYYKEIFPYNEDGE